MFGSPAITALKQAIPDGQFALQGSENFDKLNSSYLSHLESDIKPTCIFQPQSQEDVAVFLRTIQPFALSGEAKFAIRGGGQQPVPGCANVQDGITVNLDLLTGIEVKDGLVQVAAGERWGRVYEKLHPEGLGVTGGRSSGGGIGGLSLQGGLSFFSSREGFICDNVVNYQVVLASGETVNANANENSDLWRALRGGGNNFGIVTRYDFRTFKQGPMWGGSVYYFLPSLPSQIENLVKELQNPDATDETHLMMSIGYAGAISKDAVCLNQLYYTQAVEKPPVLEPFSAIQPQMENFNSMRMVTLKDAAAEQAAAGQTGVRCAYMNITVKADVATLQAGSEIYKEALEPVKPVEGLMCSFTLQPYPVSLLKKCTSHGGNSLGLDATNGPLVSVLLLSYWKNVGDDDAILGMMKSALERIKDDAASRNQLVPYVYMNYAFTHQNPLSSYGEGNKQNLQQVSRKYDPEGLFQKGCPGGFKLFS